MGEEIKELISSDEKIYYEGKPYKKCYDLEWIFNPLLPFAIIWTLVDSVFFISAIATKSFSAIAFMLMFLAVHMTPVWVYLFGVFTANKRYKTEYYVITDKAIYISSGPFYADVEVLPYVDIVDVSLYRGIFDRKFNVGDVVFTTNELTSKGRRKKVIMGSIAYYKDVCDVAKKLRKKNRIN